MTGSLTIVDGLPRIVSAPDMGVHHVVWKDLIIFLWVDHDDWVGDPLKDTDCYGEIVSRIDRSITHDVARFHDLRDEPDCVVLGYFEHGDCDWHVGDRQTFGMQGDYFWDGTPGAGLWIPNDHLLKYELEPLKDPVERRARAVELAGQACQVFTAWCNGYVYAVGIKAYRARYSPLKELYDDLNDYRYDTPCYDAHICGLYDYEGLKAAVDDYLNPWLEDIVKHGKMQNT